MQIVTEVTRQE